MQHINAVRVFQRVHGSECIAAKILNHFKHPCPTKAGQHFGIAMFATALRDINRIAHLMLDRIRKVLQILAARPHPDHRLERRLFSHLGQYSDFTIFCQGLAHRFEAVAQALSRLTRQGRLERLSKGVYYSTRQTAFGKSRPNPTALQKLASRRKGVFPAGIAAANLLGFTTQTARRSEISTSALSLPRKLVGSDTVIHTRRPEAWASLSESDAALLDFLRRAGRTSELSPEETVRRTVKLLSEKGRFERQLRVAASEPPRVRAMIGAIGEQLGKNRAALRRLRDSLNPFSRFDFGLLAGLRHARNWQARERR